MEKAKGILKKVLLPNSCKRCKRATFNERPLRKLKKQNKTDLQDGLDYMYLYEVKLKAVTFSEKIILN